MDQTEEELEQIATWFSQEGLAPDSSKDAQLRLLWRAHQRTRNHLSSVTRDLDIQRSQHLAEMAEVRKSLEQIRILTEHKDDLAQEIQDENDQLKDQLRRLISIQDIQISEVAKMLYQQGLTELIHSSPSEQVAYLLVERASLIELSGDPDSRMGDGYTTSTLGTETQVKNSNAHESPHKGAPRHGQSPWRRLFGLHKTSQSKHTFIPVEAQLLTGQVSSVEKERSRLERDVEEGSRRLAMAHNEIRRLTDELESAHLTQRAYEPELQAAQQEVEQLRQKVGKLKKYELVELRKAKELNDRLDLEIRALRNRVRCLDAERSSLEKMVVPLQEAVEQLQSALQEQQQQAKQQLLTVQVQAEQAMELTKVVSLQTKVESPLQEQQQQQQAEQQLLTVHIQANQVNELAKIHSLTQHLDDTDNLITTSFTKQNNLQDLKLWKQKEAYSQCGNTVQQLEHSFKTEDKEPQTQLYKEITLHKKWPDYQEAVRALLSSQDECKTLTEEICETLKRLDKERSKYHEMKEKHKAKLCHAKEKFADEITWRDEKIRSLERELSLCSHSLTKEKELVISITVENDKLLVERRRLLQQLNEEEHKKKDSNRTASLSKCRVDFLETENKKLGNKILQMSNQLAVLERILQNMQSLHFAEELKKICNPQISAPPSAQTSQLMMPEPFKSQTLMDDTQGNRTVQTDVTSSPHCLISAVLSRSAEMGYLNLSSAQNHSAPSDIVSSSENTCS
ncbi:coiled-coil domain-containing protein 30 isoform X2 [Mastacembelus armatus]|uniref:coiled-coil domain-containing protein 30 isoform X2 n=1 Tax=Mastacembelus armatus TaxID=205130 RepID=UPI000E45C755|nr:coiled-coil domain-containing protein 30-like isoform X2 [Mastacembelus armatus]